MDLNKLTQGYDMGVVSFLGEDDYPISFPFKNFRTDSEKLLIIDRPKGLRLNVNEGQEASILFHMFKESVEGKETFEGLKSVRFQGKFTKVNYDHLELTPQSCYAWSRGGSLNTLRFILDGKRRTKKYLRRARFHLNGGK